MRKKINIVLVLITTLLVSAGFAPVGSAQTALPAIGRSLPAHHPHPFVQGILNQVDIGVAYEYLRDLTGEQAAIIEGQPYTIITRHTDSGEPVEKATQYVAEHLDALGLAVELHTWQDGRPPNVIAEIPGETHPEEIFIICAHLDDMPGGGVALVRCIAALDGLRVRGADERLGVKIIRRALEAPMRQIAKNAGEEGSVVVDEVLAGGKGRTDDWGWDAKQGEYVDMVKAGIIDPAKVVRSALQNAASIAGLMLTTETLITDLKKKDEAALGAEL